jgi:hypothetical protein
MTQILGATISTFDLDTLVGGSTDGWITDSNTWVYVSASTFKIVGSDVTAIFKAGTRLKWTQTTVKYGVVISSAFAGGDTTVTIAVNSNYVVTNAVISLNYYSYMDPPDYPGYFDFATTWVGFSANPTVIYRYAIVGRNCIINISSLTRGTSNATTLTLTTPVLSKDIAGYYQYGIVPWAKDNGVIINDAVCWTTPNSNVLTANKSASSNAWTSSGLKQIDAKIIVEF